ncbi:MULTISPECIES: fibronectin type III domain-containing protein [Mesonia]|uniref:Uncharacterized protein n=1 Tax=Mesonia oceanica TaxID=2687242 RepID=A0AC61Y407_9FLAO|nr:MULTISPECIES: fibronectin type III domain-containing protein [Mesonia]MAN28807.1 hypothetical protein [Mesonia sp.]MAQ41861.1 hypothetical protein [Mesonia sp.]MBJ99016.1 hypothetical protein [Flavobacteriaceae bacterium]VVU99216.1 hypothetical protein FVB9532_00468 [Mesonia oceanica]|tara:strand:+ start:70698 stop:72047 length:1350 start_codon:yes stop_codon:yes gene_type:complete
MILKDIHRRRKEGYKPNTFIGGVGASLSSPNHFEQYFIGLNEEDIQNFQIDANNNISFYIEKDYDIKQFFFKNENDASYYIDSEGYLKKINQGSFKGLPNFKCFYSPSMISHRSGGGYGGFGNMGLLKSMYLPLLEHTENSFINNNEKAKLLYFPNLREIWLQNVGRKSFYGLKSAKHLYIANCKKLPEIYKGYNSLHIFNQISNGCKIYANPALEKGQAYCEYIVGSLVAGDTFTVNDLTYTAVDRAALDTSEFDISTAKTEHLAYAINNDERVGEIGKLKALFYKNNIMVQSSETGELGNETKHSYIGDFVLKSSSATHFIGGNEPSYWLKLARDNFGAQLIFPNDLEDPTPVGVPKGLNVSSVTSTSFDLNFTPPMPNVNGNNGYEIWLYDGITVWQKYTPFDVIEKSGDTVNDLESGKKYTLKIRTFDGFYNLGKFSEETVFKTL